MDQQKITELLQQQNTEIAERTPFCPDDHEIAAYFDRYPHHPEGELSEHHLINCGYCLARVAVLAQLHKYGDDEQIQDSLLDKADKFGQQSRRRLRFAPAWAVAAVVMITLFTIVGREPTIDPDVGAQLPAVSLVDADARQLRNINRSHPAPTILTPVKGANVRPEKLTIRWTTVPGSLYYDIRLVNAEGFMIWQDRIEENKSNLPDNLKLIPGDPYFVRVDAYLAEAKSISSRHVQFTINGSN
jgi:hypothetical protein